MTDMTRAAVVCLLAFALNSVLVSCEQDPTQDATQDATQVSTEGPTVTPQDDQDEDDYEYEDFDPMGGDCEPSLADHCFEDVNENLLCHLLSPIGRNCTMRNAQDLCLGLADALNCSIGIIYSDCVYAQGRDVFTTWHAGLRAVVLTMCDATNMPLVQEMLDNSRCWNFKKFIGCVESKAKVSHVSDLLTTELNAKECNLLQLAVGACNANAEKNRWQCQGKADIVHTALATFFQATNCGALTSTCSALHTSGGVAGATLISTAVVMAVLMVLLLILLNKAGFVTVRRPSLGRPAVQEDDDGVLDNYSRLT